MSTVQVMGGTSDDKMDNTNVTIVCHDDTGWSGGCWVDKVSF